MTLVTSLYNSKNKETAVSNLVQLVEFHAAEKGLTVSRWQANRGNFDCTVTWAVHTGVRPSFSRDLPEDAHVVSFTGIEGTTKKCKAYKAIYELLEGVR